MIIKTRRRTKMRERKYYFSKWLYEYDLRHGHSDGYLTEAQLAELDGVQADKNGEILLGGKRYIVKLQHCELD